MKLYATVSSERASKGQGGNEYLITEIKDKDQRLLLTVHITAAKSHLRGEHYNIYITNHQSEYLAITNGDADRFKMVLCQAPGCKQAPEAGTESAYCSDHEPKGEKQKGEPRIESVAHKNWREMKESEGI